jgi:3-deoxy-D-manno-octulosonic-acid transferase
MYFIYSLLLVLAFIVLLPRFIVDAFFHGKYVAGFRERLGSLTPLREDIRPTIWLHCVSVGETQAARPLVKALKESLPSHRVVISTITKTGQELAREVFKNSAEKIFYFPFDWGWTARRTLRTINPTTVLIMETELWPGFLRQCKKKNIPVAIVNGRLSARSFRRYRLIKGFMRRVLASVRIAIMQTEPDAERLQMLGMESSKTHVAGNLKFDAGAMATTGDLTRELRERFETTNCLWILAASTHAPEEGIILDAFKQACALSQSRLRLMIAPRHPERFSDVAKLIASKRFSAVRRSQSDSPADANAEVVLLDSIGELQSTYELASIVFMGGSISRSGGHNILEPAAVGACIITGPNTHNFHQIVETFLKADAIVQLPRIPEEEAAAELSKVFSLLLGDAARRKELGDRARQIVQNNRGATERALALLKPLINASRPAPGSTPAFRVQDAPTT